MKLTLIFRLGSVFSKIGFGVVNASGGCVCSHSDRAVVWGTSANCALRTGAFHRTPSFMSEAFTASMRRPRVSRMDANAGIVAKTKTGQSFHRAIIHLGQQSRLTI